MTRIKLNRRKSERLLNRVLNYNLKNAALAAFKGKTPFPKSLNKIGSSSILHGSRELLNNSNSNQTLYGSRELLNNSNSSQIYSWDQDIPFSERSTYSPFQKMATRSDEVFRGEGEVVADLNTSMVSISSNITSYSVMEDRLNTDPHRFVSKCRRVLIMATSILPETQVYEQMNSKSLTTLHTKLTRNVAKLTSYASLLEDFIEDDSSDENVAIVELQNVYKDLEQTGSTLQAHCDSIEGRIRMVERMEMTTNQSLGMVRLGDPLSSSEQLFGGLGKKLVYQDLLSDQSSETGTKPKKVTAPVDKVVMGTMAMSTNTLMVASESNHMDSNVLGAMGAINLESIEVNRGASNIPMGTPHMLVSNEVIPKVSTHPTRTAETITGPSLNCNHSQLVATNGPTFVGNPVSVAPTPTDSPPTTTLISQQNSRSQVSTVEPNMKGIPVQSTHLDIATRPPIMASRPVSHEPTSISSSLRFSTAPFLPTTTHNSLPQQTIVKPTDTTLTTTFVPMNTVFSQPMPMTRNACYGNSTVTQAYPAHPHNIDQWTYQTPQVDRSRESRMPSHTDGYFPDPVESTNNLVNISDDSDVENWRNFTYVPKRFIEKTIVDDLKAIEKILNIGLGDKISDAEINSLESKEARELSKILSNLSDRLLKLEEKGNCSTEMVRLIQLASDAIDESNEWQSELKQIVRKRELWFTGTKTLGTPLKLEPFDGWKSTLTIFEFHAMFDVITKNISKQDKAQFLYNNYVSKDLQAILKHVRHDYESQVKILISKFGDVSRILDEKKSQIKNLQHPTKFNEHQEVKYYKGVAEILDQLETIVEEHSQSRPDLPKEIYNYTSTNNIVRLLPKYIRDEWIEDYINLSEKYYDGDEVPGEASFKALIKFIHRRYRKKEIMVDKLLNKEEVLKRKPVSSVNAVDKGKSNQSNSGKPFGQGQSQHNRKPFGGKPAGQSVPKKDDWLRSVCFMHDEIKKKVRDCPMGQCPNFLNASPEARQMKVDQFGLCRTCFLYKCYKKQTNGKCLYKSQLPVLVICQACATENSEDCNVLLCSSHKNDSPQVRQALSKFIAGYDDSSYIKINMFNINKLNADIAKSKPNSDGKVYNVENGNIIDEKEVLHKVNQEPKDDSLYILQQWIINGQEATVLYDTGASTSAVQGEFATKVGFNVLDPRSQCISVAGGATVQTGYGVFAATVGPTEEGTWHRVNLLGMTQITSRVPRFELETLVNECKRELSSSPIAKETFPLSVGGDEVKIIIGVSESALMPRLITILPNGLQVYRAAVRDKYGSNIILAGPHHLITETNNRSAGFHNISIFLTDHYRTCRSAIDKDHFFFGEEPKEDKLPPSFHVEEGFTPILATALEHNHPIRVCSLAGGPKCDCSDSTSADSIPASFCKCCFTPGMGTDNPSEICNLSDEADTSPSESCLIKANIVDDSKLLAEILDDVTNVCTSHDACIECNSTRDLLAKTGKFKRPKLMEDKLQEMEDVGSRISYRCAKCANCAECKSSDKTREQSIQDVLQESIINDVIDIDVENKVTYTKFPFKRDPVEYLKKLWNGKDNNLYSAMKTFNQQRNKSQECRAATVKFHQELVDKGFVIPLSSLSVEAQSAIMNAPIKNFLLWRTVFKPESMSTPARIVVDPTMSGFNDCLCKGVNCLNNLFMIVINWRSWEVGFTADISKMYNSIKLYESEYPYTLYLWSETLDPAEDYEIFLYVVVTYGLVSSGNITTAALRRIATMFKEKFPLAYCVILKWTYMDDISGGKRTVAEIKETIAQVEAVIQLAGFKLKVSCVSGEKPTEKASPDGIHTTFAGYKWATEADIIKVGFTEVNFNQKKRGAKAANLEPIDTTEKVEELVDKTPLTRRIVLAKVMELYDTQGIVEPIKAKLKLDMKKVVSYDYDEVLPTEQQLLWKENITLIHNAQHISFPRSFVPIGTVPNSIQLIASCDAAALMAGVVVHAKTQMEDGSFNVRFVTARSKSCDQTIPRNELSGIVLAAETLHCVLKALGSRVKDYIILTDSAIALAWVKNEEKPLKQFVFNRVIQIRRLIDIERLFHIPGESNPSDILTKDRKILVSDMDLNSAWQVGEKWMYDDIELWPIQTYEQVCGKIVSDSFEKEFIHIPGIKVLNGQAVWDLTENCCKVPAAIENCHCFQSEDCCHCSTQRVLKTYGEIASRPPCNNTMVSEAYVISQVYAAVENGLSEETILSRFSTFTMKPSNKPILPSLATICKVSKCTEYYPVNPVRYGFRKFLSVVTCIVKFATKARHYGHLKRISFDDRCHLCKLQFNNQPFSGPLEPLQSCNVVAPRGSSYTQYDSFVTWKMICKIATKEVYQGTTESQRESYCTGSDGILYSSGRLPAPVLLSKDNPLYNSFSFVRPVALASSELVYSLIMHLHWQYNHPGVERMVFLTLQTLHVPNVRKVCKYIRKTCNRCRYILKKTLRVEVGRQNQLTFTVAPVFFSAQMDIAVGLSAYSINTRATKPAYMLILVCMTTGCISVTIMEDVSTESVIQGLERHSGRYGWPKYLFPDQQSSFMKLDDLRLNFRTLQGQLKTDQKVVLDFATAGHHAEHGKVESRVKLVKDWLEKSAQKGFRHSYTQWETICIRSSNFLNSLPIARAEDSRNPADMEVFGIITPNCFIQGFNTDRQIEGSCSLIDTKSKMLSVVNETREFLESELLAQMHRFIPTDQSSKNDELPEKGSIVLFLMKDNQRARNKTWKYGKITQNYVDGRRGKVKILYKNSGEAIFREVERHLSDVVLIQSINDVDFNTVEHRRAMEIHRKYLMQL